MPSPPCSFFFPGSASNEVSPPASEVIGSDCSSSSPSHAYPHLSVLQLHLHGWEEIPHQSQALSLGNVPTLGSQRYSSLGVSVVSLGTFKKINQSSPSEQMLKAQQRGLRRAQQRVVSLPVLWETIQLPPAGTEFWELILSSDFFFFPSVYAAKDPISTLLILLCNLSGVGESRRESGGMREIMTPEPKGRNVN